MIMKPFILLFMVWAAAAAQDVPARGLTQTARPSQTLDRGRIGTQAPVPDKPLTWRGILVDAGCRDRSIANLRTPPALTAAVPPDTASADASDTPTGPAAHDGALSSHGIRVDAETAQAERTGPMRTLTPDRLTRQMDPSCAVNAGSRAFALLLADGTLLNLEEGGNTEAFQAFQSSPQGMNILNGKTVGEKPQVIIKGRRRGDKLNVISIRLQ